MDNGTQQKKQSAETKVDELQTKLAARIAELQRQEKTLMQQYFNLTGQAALVDRQLAKVQDKIGELAALVGKMQESGDSSQPR